MAAYASHLRKIRDNELLYGGEKPRPRPFTTDKDVIDTHHKFLRKDDDPTDPLVKEYYESLIKDCVLVDLSRYKETQVAMRWRTTDEVKTGKGETTCANISCTRTDDLEGMEVVFEYDEEGKDKSVLVKCVLCEKCGKKMRKAHGKDKSRKRSKSHEHESRKKGSRERSQREKHERKRRRHLPDDELEERRYYRSKDSRPHRRGTDLPDGDLGRPSPRKENIEDFSAT